MAQFLIKWKIKAVNQQSLAAILQMPEYFNELKKKNILEHRYHIVGHHGGFIIIKVSDHTELEKNLALMPIYNIAKFKIYPLTQMS